MPVIFVVYNPTKRDWSEANAIKNLLRIASKKSPRPCPENARIDTEKN